MKRIKCLVLPVIFSLLALSCKDKATNPPENQNPPGYQEDIPWPSLADSPWPMNHHDPQSTGRSQYSGPLNGTLDWMMDSLSLESGIVTGLDSNIIFLSVFTNSNRGLYSVSYSGNILWKKSDTLQYFTWSSTPLIGKDGTTYFTGGYDGTFYAVKPNGTVKWKYQLNSSTSSLGINIGKDGILYFLTTDKKLNAIDQNGNLLWQYEYSDFPVWTGTVITFSPDGKTLYIPGSNEKTVYAFNIEGKSIKWSFGEGRSWAAPIVDTDGNIYILGKSAEYTNDKPALISLRSDGTVRWVFIHNNLQELYGEGTIDKNGNIYFAFDTLYSVDYKGNLRWKKTLDGSTDTPLVCDAGGRIYTVVFIGGGYIEIESFNSEGNLIWQYTPSNSNLNGASPAIGFERLFVPSYESNSLITIK